MTRVDESSSCVISISGSSENSGKELTATLGEVITLLEKFSRTIKGDNLTRFFKKLFSDSILAYTSINTFDPAVPEMISVNIEGDDVLYIDCTSDEIDTIEEFEKAPFFLALVEKRNINNLILFLRSVLITYRTFNTIYVLNKQLLLGYGDESQNPTKIIFKSDQPLRYWIKYENDWLRLDTSQTSTQEITDYLTNSKTLIELEEKLITLLG